MQTFQESSRRGVTFVELVVASSVLLVGVLAVTSSSLACSARLQVAQEGELARQALDDFAARARSIAREAGKEHVGWGTAFTAAFEPGGEMGPTLDIDGLQPWESESSVGSVEVVCDETMTDAELGLELGMPRDLDLDGAIDNPDTRDDARSFPVIVTLRWKGAAGRRRLVHGFWVSGD